MASRGDPSNFVAGTSNEVDEAYISDSVRSLPVVSNAILRPNTHSLPVDNPPRLDGHDELFDPPFGQDYECPICMLCLRDPVQTKCGHRFCRSCIERHLRLNPRRCPVDNQELGINDVFADNFAKREINQFTVKCRTTKEDKPCPWKGELQSLEAHLAVCEFFSVPCPNACGQDMERKSVEIHTKKECPKRKVSCQHCKMDVLQKNLKDHLDKCQKVQIACPNCKQKMLREKLPGHSQTCPKVQINCEFRESGCKWTGPRSNLNVHIQNDMARHLSYLRSSILKRENENQMAQLSSAALSTSQSSAGASTSQANESSQPGLNPLAELNKKVERNGHAINQLKQQTEQMDRRLHEELASLGRRIDEYNVATTEMKKNMGELEARMCNGVFLWRIKNYNKHIEDARRGLATAVHSSPFYTSLYGYKLCLRINPNGVDTGYGSHVSLFVHMMQSEWDDTLEWPFSGRISLSILDQSDETEHKRHISETLVTRPTLLAFQRPTTPRNHKGYGYVEFAHLDTLQERQYIKNDCLLVRVQVFH